MNYTCYCCLLICFLLPCRQLRGANIPQSGRAANAGFYSVAGEIGNDSFPKPTGIPNMLFYLQRTYNANTIIYELNLDKKGELNTKKPVNMYWIRYTEKGQREELSKIQRDFAYGVKTKKNADNSYAVHFIAFGKISLALRKDRDGQYRVYTDINNRQAALQSIFIKIDGDSDWNPDVKYFELSGTDALTHEPVKGIIYP